MKTNFNSEIALDLARKKVEKHYEDKFVYALPDWAMLSANPEIIAVIAIYGAEGITIAKQRVDFAVDFKDSVSIRHYADFLNNQMDKTLDVLGYIVLFDKKVYSKKDVNYKEELTANQEIEIAQHNQLGEGLEISILHLTKDYEPIEDINELL